MKLIAATTNKHKIEEIKAIARPLGYSVVSRAEAGVPDFEIEENGATFEENSLIKARAIFDWLGGRVCSVADDSGLEVDALDGAPGVYSARFAEVGGAPGTAAAQCSKTIRPVQKSCETHLQMPAAEVERSVQDQANNGKLLGLLEGVPKELRTARFVSVITCLRPGKDPIVCRGEVQGHVDFEQTGEAGFGYDPLFIPLGYDRSFGLFTPEEKNAVSHRGRALRKIGFMLREIERVRGLK